MTLDDAIATALFQNPDLITLRGQEGVSRAALGVARTYPWNPFVQAQYFPNGSPLVLSNQPGGSAGMSNYYIWVMQRFELAHQMRFRKQAAGALLTQVQWNIQQGELINVAQTTRLYFAALYQRELRDLAYEFAQINDRLLGVVERRLHANLATPADMTMARVAARQTRRQADLAEANYQTALLALRQQMNLPLEAPLVVDDRITSFAWSPVQCIDPESPSLSPTQLAGALVQSRPDLMAASAGVAVANANAWLARAARMPDLQVGPIVDTGDDGTQYMGLRVQSDIPVLNTGKPLANQRHAELQQQRLTFAQLNQRAVIEAQTAIDRYERARRLAEAAAADHAGPSAAVPAELRDITAQFEGGQAEVVAVLNTQANLVLDRRAYLDLLNELAQAAANVVQATALPPRRLAILPKP
jgi:cobalt-zinc-cadmium efflux system outer membrane protein